MMSIQEWEPLLQARISEAVSSDDPAHDLLHFKRVVATAKSLCTQEGAKLEVVLPAAWLHDLVNVPKNDPRRKQASQLSADAAIDFLSQINYPEKYFNEIHHAIAAHSFSAEIETKSVEACVVQDADRLDGLGAIGLARCFVVAGMLKRPLYSELDPFCKDRSVDDQKFTIDHFYAKLFKTADSLKTKAGQQEGARRVALMKRYLDDLSLEIL
jgi:uncharacterized protein